MNYTESLDYIYNAKQAGAVKNGLVNITELLKRLGNPEARFKSIHIAGTNGKGSVCAYIESVLRTAGYKTGLFTSPYLERFTERIRIGTEEIAQDEFAAIATEVRAAADSMVREGLTHPTFFELVTACGFIHFARKQIDVAVVEAGLGGRTDATNVLMPLVSVIATIGIDHADALGSTIELIAGEKAGIIKPGVPCVLSGANAHEAAGVIRHAAAKAGSSLVSGSDYEMKQICDGLDGQAFDLKGCCIELRGLEIGLLGAYQLDNATTAVSAVLELNKLGFSISDEALREGLRQARWPGRMELLRTEPPVLLDGAHNPQGAEALADGVLRYLSGQSVCLVTGTMADKDAEPMVVQFSRFADKVITTLPPTYNRQQKDAGDLAELFRRRGIEATACEDWRQALTEGLGSGLAVVVAGSLYLAGAARTFLQSLSAEPSPALSVGPPSGGSSVGAAVAPEGAGLASG
jgi:dihydrofolate synthase / folylpolyglutamate synthase